MTQLRKKMIEVALPLDDINKAAAKEKSIRHGHPSTLHLWWARRPLAACRAVLFASLVDDPSSYLDETAAEAERERLFGIIRRLVLWENSNNEAVLAEARAEIRRCVGENPPPVLDPFCGGGSIPLEAQRLGLEAHGSDLNPVAVLITKALIEIPPRFANQPPVNPERQGGTGGKAAWRGAAGLAADVRSYGAWMRQEAEKRIGHLYPKAKLPTGGESLPRSERGATVIAWLWARTVTCPNPACGAAMPLVSSFALSTKAGKKAWVEPVVVGEGPVPSLGSKHVRFEVHTGAGDPPEPPKLGRGARFKCLVCGQTAPEQHIKAEGMAGRMDAQLLAIVAEGNRGRVYLAPTAEQEETARSAEPTWMPAQHMPQNPRWFSPPFYGLATYGDLFTPRQLVALTTFSDLVGEARARALDDARAAGLPDDPTPLHQGGSGATAYADAVATYLGMTCSRLANSHCTLAIWSPTRDQTKNGFSRQAIPMTWDFAEINPFAKAAGDYGEAIDTTARGLAALPAMAHGCVSQADATRIHESRPILVSTDPPYYDNIGYADLSDFFYVWLRRSIGHVYPDLFRTLLVPKADELIATPYRHEGSREKADRFFESGLARAFAAIRQVQRPDLPLTIYYAFKQEEEDGQDASGAITASTGWETMLEGVLAAGFSVTGTWPMRTERSVRSVGLGTNALASSIVIVCRPRQIDAALATRREFTNTLRQELPDALIALQHGNIAPVDLAQATIGPGMAIYSRYAKVLEADGTPMRVRAALQLINQELDAYLEAQEGELDPDTRFCIAWYDQHGYDDGPFGEADVLARAKNTSVDGLRRAGVIKTEGGKVTLLRRDKMDADWDPREDRRVPVWECAQQVIRRFETEGQVAAGALLAVLGPELAEAARALAYRLFTLCERRGRADEALSYNGLVTAWTDIQAAAGLSVQGRLGM
ncbi:MAG: DUF1156 domain-containing protein [Thermomicrobiales bacterium]